MIEVLKDHLKEAETMNEIFDIVSTYYDCDDDLGVLAKQAVIMSIGKLVKVTGLQELEEE